MKFSEFLEMLDTFKSTLTDDPEVYLEVNGEYAKPDGVELSVGDVVITS